MLSSKWHVVGDKVKINSDTGTYEWNEKEKEYIGRYLEIDKIILEPYLPRLFHMKDTPNDVWFRDFQFMPAEELVEDTMSNFHKRVISNMTMHDRVRMCIAKSQELKFYLSLLKYEEKRMYEEWEGSEDRYYPGWL